jgi:hypothetical protein
MPEQISKYPDVTLQVLKGAGARCGERIPPKILVKWGDLCLRHNGDPADDADHDQGARASGLSRGAAIVDGSSRALECRDDSAGRSLGRRLRDWPLSITGRSIEAIARRVLGRWARTIASTAPRSRGAEP